MKKTIVLLFAILLIVGCAGCFKQEEAEAKITITVEKNYENFDDLFFMTYGNILYGIDKTSLEIKLKYVSSGTIVDPEASGNKLFMTCTKGKLGTISLYLIAINNKGEILSETPTAGHYGEIANGKYFIENEKCEIYDCQSYQKLAEIPFDKPGSFPVSDGNIVYIPVNEYSPSYLLKIDSSTLVSEKQYEPYAGLGNTGYMGDNCAVDGFFYSTFGQENLLQKYDPTKKVVISRINVRDFIKIPDKYDIPEAKPSPQNDLIMLTGITTVGDDILAFIEGYGVCYGYYRLLRFDKDLKFKEEIDCTSPDIKSLGFLRQTTGDNLIFEDYDKVDVYNYKNKTWKIIQL